MSMQECEDHHAAWSGPRRIDKLREEVLRVIHDLESWRAVESNFDSRKLIDDAAKKLRAAIGETP